jgi:acetyltransferase-like isoleucine patch superfamily enzyme
MVSLRMPNALPLLFDTLYWLFWTIVYTGSAALSLLVADWLWGPSVLSRAFALVVGYLVFLHAFVVILGVLKRLVQPRLQPGRSEAGSRAFLAWGLNSVFQGIFTAAFCADQIHLLFWLRYTYYRLMGMKLFPSTIIGTGCDLRQVELIELGRGVTIGMNVTLSCHINPDGKSHVQGPIRIGAGSLIGTGCRIGPGSLIGQNCVVGANSSLSPNVVLEDDVRIGPHVFLRPGVRVGAGLRIPAGTVVDQDVSA